MKALSVLGVTLVFSLQSFGQAPEPPAVAEIGPHHRVVKYVENLIDDQGGAITVTNSYVELATGLNYFDAAAGQWLLSKEQFMELPDAFVAAQGQHQLILSKNINAAASVDLLLPDGQRLQSNPMGLSFFDPVSGKNVLLGEVKDCTGELIAPNVVLFADAFTDIKAAIKYEFTKSGIAQDVILLEGAGIGSPSDFGLPEGGTLLEMYSEFHSPPAPEKSTAAVGNDLSDETIHFGQMAIGRGAAYALNEEMESTPVAKTWVKMDGRDFLIESVPYAAIKPMLEKSGANGQASRTDRNAVEGRKGLVAGLQPREKALRVAGIKPSGRRANSGLAIDYTTINTSQTNFTWKGDVCYYLSGNVALFGTNTTFEGGSVLKYTNNVALTVNTPITWLATEYRPVLMLSKDDNSVCENIAGSTGNPSNYVYATAALFIDANAAGASATIQNLRVAYAKTAIGINGRSGHVISHAQLVNCQNGLAATNAEFSLRNALFHNVLTNFTGSTSTGRVEHLTVNTASWLNNNIGANLFLTNTLLVSVTNYGSYTGNSVYTASGSGVFQSVGQGSHYLSASSTYRNAGTTNVAILPDVRKTTTYPPLILTNDFTVSTTLSPQAQRDTDQPDIGWHYWPLDYCWSGLNLTNATLTLTNGVAVGIYGAKGTLLRTGGNFACEGRAENLNRLTRYQSVQEQSQAWGSTPAGLFEIPSTYSPRPTVELRFTDVALMGATTSHGSRQLLPSGSGNPLSKLTIAHSSLRGVSLLYYPADSSSVTVAFTNSVVERCYFDLQKTYGAQNTPFTVNLRNTLFWNGTLTLYYVTGSSNPYWDVRDNSFDKVSLTQNDSSGYILKSHNAYINATSLGGSSNVVLTNFTYAPGPLGPWYHSSTNLIDKGNRNSTNATLYHFTTRADQTKETNSIVDIGFHFPAISKVVFVGTDATTLGDWKGVYGSEGHEVIQDSSSYPSYATVTPTGKADYTWNSAPTETRALLRGGTGRIAACWYSGTYFDVALTQSGGLPHRLAIYCLDWDWARAETIDIRDSGTGAVYDSRSVTNFNGGRYYVWDILGDATIRVTDLPGYNAVISGLFFGPATPTLTDYDGDGYPDYLEDRNGNGTYDSASGETDWQISNSGISGAAGLQVFTPLK